MGDNDRDRLGAVSSEGEPEAPPSLHVEDDGELSYFTCPVCRSQIKEPFDPQGGPQAVVHRHKDRRTARLIVHPRLGTVREIPRRVSLEEALRRELQRAS